MVTVYMTAVIHTKVYRRQPYKHAIKQLYIYTNTHKYIYIYITICSVLSGWALQSCL